MIKPLPAWARGALAALSLTSGLRGAEPAPRTTPSDADRSPAGGWVLADFAEEMKSPRGRSYAAGQRVFERAHCVMCHRQDGVGHEFGPDLTKLDERFQPNDILRDILDPSRRIADGKFDVWMFETTSGRGVVGLIRRESDKAFEVMEKPPALAPPVVLPKTDVEARQMSLVSIMPRGLLDEFSRQEIVDLVAYVAGRGDRAAPLFRQEP